LPPELKGSITFDNGSEFARHSLLASVSGITLRCLRQLAKGQRREHQRQAQATFPATARPRHRQPGRTAGDRPLAQSHATKVPRLHHPDPGLLQRPWQRHSDPICLTGTTLHLAREFTPAAGQNPGDRARRLRASRQRSPWGG
jgi:hypothetical protein